MMSLIAFSGPIRRGRSWVPPHPGTRPRKHSGRAIAVTPEETVRYVQCSAISRPPPMAAPLMNANDGTCSSPNRRNTWWPREAIALASSRVAILAAPFRSAPTAKMNGLPTRPTATMSVRAATASRVAFSSIRPWAPKVLGLVWSKPLSSVIRAIVPAPYGSSTSRTRALVTTSSVFLPARRDVYCSMLLMPGSPR